MTQLTPEERERVLDSLRAELVHDLSISRQLNEDGAARIERQLAALDQLRAESGLLGKCERLMLAGWQVVPPDGARYGCWWIEKSATSGDHYPGPTLTAALKSAPEPER